ncbi:hal9p [Saccharomyces arboricola H-6]|uniref:Hal9p n=1 Tax=Saccharomyces arboricola (strain H-6 / AS 2.3317 / CBS 10644) TaxID=1160507 RepID=J8Q2K6_SACAR|nr:hal9p [Saccharomyces arboricola H-6]
MDNQGGDYGSNAFSNSPNNINAVFNNENMGRSDISGLNQQKNTTRLVPEAQIWSIPVPDQLMTVPNRENSMISGHAVGSNIPMNVAYPNNIYPPMEQHSQIQTQQQQDVCIMMEHTNSNDLAASSKNLKKRVSKACDHCRKRKIRCDEVDPQTSKCSNCVKFQSACTFKHRDEILKKKRKLESKQNSTSDKSRHIQNSVPNRISSSIPQSIDTVPFDSFNSNASLDSEIINKVSNMQNNFNKKMNSKIEKLDRKMSYIIDSVARFEWLLDKVVKKQEDKHKENNNLPKPTRKIYSTAVLTAQKLYWFKQGLGTKVTNEEFLSPISEILSISLKWYATQMKKFMDLSSPAFFSSEIILYSLPPKRQAKRLLENFHATLLSSVTGIISLKECLDLAEKYYSESTEKLTYPEHLLLNVCLCSGASATQPIIRGDSKYLRKDRYDPTSRELKMIENVALLNAMYYYHKLANICSGTRTLQALLLLNRYFQLTYDTELASSILGTAIRLAVDMELNRKSSYKSLDFEEAMKRRSMWWHCFCTDKLYSLILSRPPIVGEQDMDMLTDQNYYEVIKYDILPDIIDNKGDIEKVTDVNSALNVVVNFCQHISLFISYYVSKLVSIESKIYSTCFAVRSTLDLSFDAMLDKIIELNDSLNNWRNNLHVSMKLKTYKQYLSVLYAQNSQENPALSFEIACCRVLHCHFRSLYSIVILSMLTTSLLIDNRRLYKGSRHDIPQIFMLFSVQYLDASKEMLKLFQGIDYQTHMYNEVMYQFSTAVFVLFFYVVDNIKDPKKTADVKDTIELLKKSYDHLVGENDEQLLFDNVKWNTFIVFYSHFLKFILQRYHEINGTILEFDPKPYEEIIAKVITHSSKIKDETVDQLIMSLKSYGSFHSLQEDNEAGLADDELNTDDITSDDFTGEPPINLFGELSVNILKMLKSHSPIYDNRDLSPLSKNKEISDDSSLYPMRSDSACLVYPIHSSDTEDSPSPDIDATDNRDSSNDDSISKDFKAFSRLLPLGKLIYDRDYSFVNTFRDYE